MAVPTAVADGVVHEARFRAMGTEAHIVAVGGHASLPRHGEARVRQLEQRWSRFLPTSELNQLNRHAGQPVIVTDDTFELVTRAVDAWRLTGGRFDPTVAAALAAHGYDRDFTALVTTPTRGDTVGAPSPGLAGVELLSELDAVTLPAGVTIDAGGIGKGLAGDLTAQLLVDLGADGAMVNLGGDLRAVGRPPSADGWVISVPDPFQPDHELLRLAMAGGAVATSSRLLRRWQTTTGEAHHLIDPLTGHPAATDVVAVTVVAAQGWLAEALTKALFLTGPAALADLGDGAHAVIVMADGTRHATPGLASTLR